MLISLTAGAWSASFFWNQRWLLIIGLVIICQEIYEGAVISSALRDGAKIEKEKKIFPQLYRLISYLSVKLCNR